MGRRRFREVPTRESGDRPEALVHGAAVGGSGEAITLVVSAHSLRDPCLYGLRGCAHCERRVSIMSRHQRVGGIVFAVVVVSVFLLNPSYAAIDFEPIIVTATRTAETADETLASVTVITRDEIERRQALSVQDLLRGVVGLGVANSGGPGKATSVFLRGTEEDHVLVLIDGVKIGSATLGTTAFQNIPIDQIERIEIVRGPRSSLYGSEAIGGVIQIFTRKGQGPLMLSFSMGIGSHQSNTLSAGISGGAKRGWYNLSASGFDTNGFNACDGKPSPNGAGCFTFEPDNDGYQNYSGALRAGYRFSSSVKVEAHVLHAKGDNEFDGSFVNESDFVQQIIGGKLQFAPTKYWHLALSLGRSRDESENFLNGTSMTVFDTERDSISLQNDIVLGATQLVTIGFDYQDDKIDSTTDYEVTSRDNKAIFAQYQGDIATHSVQLSLRRDDNEQFNSHTTGTFAWGYVFPNRVRLTATYGTAFKAPTFNELFFPNFGNPNLDPEESSSVEFGVSGAANLVNWSLNIYQTKVDDLTAFDPSFTPANIAEARIRGLEAVVDTRFRGWDLAANLTLLDPENRTNGSDRGNVLPRRGEQTLRLDANRDLGKFQFGTTVIAEGRRYNDLANTQRLGGFTTVDLRAEIALYKHWRVQARVGNLFDKRYETAELFNQDGRNCFLTLRYHSAAT